jgi:hypothetical protein
VTLAYGFLTDSCQSSLRISKGFFALWLTDFVRISGAFGGGGLRIVYGFLPDFGDAAAGLCTHFYRIWGEEAYGLCTDVCRILRRRPTDCVRMFTGFGGGGLRIVYGF